MFIKKTADGVVIGAFTMPQPHDDGVVEVSDNDPEYVAFRDRDLSLPQTVHITADDLLEAIAKKGGVTREEVEAEALSRTEKITKDKT